MNSIVVACAAAATGVAIGVAVHRFLPRSRPPRLVLSGTYKVSLQNAPLDNDVGELIVTGNACTRCGFVGQALYSRNINFPYGDFSFRDNVRKDPRFETVNLWIEYEDAVAILRDPENRAGKSHETVVGDDCE